jgi:hypothetical protein
LPVAKQRRRSVLNKLGGGKLFFLFMGILAVSTLLIEILNKVLK